MQKKHNQLSKVVFSTYVEVILSFALLGIYECCILHVCGGDPTK